MVNYITPPTYIWFNEKVLNGTGVVVNIHTQCVNVYDLFYIQILLRTQY